MARPSDYRVEYAQQARKLVERGATDTEIADFFEVSVRTIYRWKNEFVEFCHALKAGKEEADAIVERSLYQRATGYEVDAVKIFCDKEGKVTKVAYREIIPPDTTAMIFWLKNRKPAEWRDKIQTELSGPDGGKIPVSLEIDL
jgi:hypothetical protein